MPKANGAVNYEVEKVLDKKVYKNKVYYKLKWVGCSNPTWELEKDCSCSLLIEEYEKRQEELHKDDEEDEWEVEEILKKRVRNNENEYLVKWKNWNGGPNWVKESVCDCVNLIAAFENPKLRKMWNFDGTNPKLWLTKEAMLKYMGKFAQKKGYKVNFIDFEPDLPECETTHQLKEGINIGPLLYNKHWYLIIILINHVCITKRLLICDPLNTLIGVPSVKLHPVFKRMTEVFKNVPARPIAMTPMDRSDTCAFFVLAGYERALFVMQERAKFIVNKLCFDVARPELIRSRILPESDGEISVALPVSGPYLDGPQCEFCDRCYDSCKQVDEHIVDEHFKTSHASTSLNLKRSRSTGSVAKKSKEQRASN